MLKKKGFLEESLADSQGKDVCRAIFDGSPDAIFLADPETGIIVDANPAASRLLWRPIHEIIGMHQKDLHPPKREEASRRIFLAHSGTDGETVQGGPEQHYAQRSDGAEIPVEITAKIIKIKGRRILQGFFRDVSARKDAEDALRESEARYRSLVDHAPVGIVVHRFGVMKYVNRRLAEIGGIPDPRALIGRNITDFIHPDSRKSALQRIQALMENRAPLPPAEHRLVAPDGRVLEMEMISIIISYQGEDCVMSLIQDISSRKRAEEDLRAAHRQLMEANLRLEERVEQRTSQLEDLNKELEAFSYSAAHDLKAPLRRINVFSDMLEKEAGAVLKDDTHDYLVNIHKSVTHMTRLVDGLLSLSTTGRRPLTLEKVALSSVLEEAAADIRAENPHRRIEWELPRLPEVNCDRAMLRQVFVNLLGNAAKYSRGRNPARIAVTYSWGRREHVFAVRDNGVGFKPEFADKLFGVFQRLHRSDEFEGTGIGLSTVKRIISRHGGRVWAEGAPDRGATFFFTLPSP